MRELYAVVGRKTDGEMQLLQNFYGGIGRFRILFALILQQ